MILNWNGHIITGTPQEIDEFLKLNQPTVVSGSLNRFVKLVDKNNSTNKITCPHCGKSYCMELYSTGTLVNVPKVYKDGVLQVPTIKNTIKTIYQCLECGKEFEVEGSGLNKDISSIKCDYENQNTSAQKVVNNSGKISNS